MHKLEQARLRHSYINIRSEESIASKIFQPPVLDDYFNATHK